MVMWFFHAAMLYTHVERRKYDQITTYPEQENNIEDICDAVHLLVTNFKKSCQTPRLVNLTADCVMEVLELVLLVNIALLEEHKEVYPKTLYTTHKILNELTDDHNGFSFVNSPVGKVLNHKYQDQLSILRYILGKYQPESEAICSLLYHCNLVE